MPKQAKYQIQNGHDAPFDYPEHHERYVLRTGVTLDWKGGAQ